jgi:hypothetical protein
VIDGGSRVCQGCGGRLYYHEQGQPFCHQCATERGIERICDRPMRKWHRIATALLVVLLSACTAPPVDYAEPAPVATPWCFAVTMRVEGEDRAAVGCADRRALCERARANAITYRRFTKMHRIGACQFQEGM